MNRTYVITYKKFVDGEKKEFVEWYDDGDFVKFINKAIFYKHYSIEYDDLKIYYGDLKEIELSNYPKTKE